MSCDEEVCALVLRSVFVNHEDHAIDFDQPQSRSIWQIQLCQYNVVYECHMSGMYTKRASATTKEHAAACLFFSDAPCLGRQSSTSWMPTNELGPDSEKGPSE
jgi:hypothetical protein